MRKYDYFTKALLAKAHYSREWVLRAMTVVFGDVTNGDIKWSLRHTKERVEVYVPSSEVVVTGSGASGETWSWQVLEDAKPYEIAFVYHESTGPIKAGDIENLDRDLPDGTWGDLLYNSRVIVYAAGRRIPYREGPIDLGKDEMYIINNMKDDPEEGADVEGELYVKHYLRFGKAVGDLSGFEVFVPSVTERALQPPPGRDELRAELLEEYKDRLDDPVAQARIQDKLVESYRQYIKGDPSEGFLYKKKSLNTALKRMFLIHGPEAGFNEGGRAKLVVNSLQEGVDIKNYPIMVNSLRAGSFYRGALTALAGEDVDLMGRIFQNSRIVPGFCGTRDLMGDIINRNYLGRTIVDGDVPVKLTEETISKYEGKYYGMFSAMWCITPGNDCCEVCMGDKLAAYPDSLGSMVSEIPSTMMARMMGSAHAKELKTTPLDIENFLR